MTDKQHDGLAASTLGDDVDRATAGMTRRELFLIGNVLAMPVLLGGVRARAEGMVEAGPASPKLGGEMVGRRRDR